MNIAGIVALLVLALCQVALAANGDAWRGRSIYQVFTDRFARTDGSTTASCDTGAADYCGGTWAGLINRLDYIQDLGFDAVWISPVTHQVEGQSIDGSAYHGYWQDDINEVNEHFGTADDLRALSAELHSRNMFLMVDIVVNHLAWIGAPDTIDYSQFPQFNNEDYFHPYCVNNYSQDNMTNTEQCWMGSTNVPLPDLRTEDSDVQNIWNAWISRLISDYSIDGLRIDSVMEVNTGFWPSFLDAAGVYALGEVYMNDPDFVARYQAYMDGVFNYAYYFPLRGAFVQGGDISSLAEMIDRVKAGAYRDTSLLGSFSENHDQPRIGALNPDMALAKNVLVGTMLVDGIPVIYQGQELHYQAYGGQSTPFNREAIWLSGYPTDGELYQATKACNAARKNAQADDSSYLTFQNYHFYTDGDTMAMRKGKMVTILSQLSSTGSDYTLNLDSGYDAGTQVTELLTCSDLTVSSNGSLAVPMSAGQPRVYYPTDSIGSQCGGSSKRMMRRSAKFRDQRWQ
ncbi:hypothetical protein CKM354_000622700 [Cercospora kikuchii]|uniref:alpha-amylase n=1 Tax=Cercospora kikuchii TaxID=84275 RepID=A0A9P3CIZ9_9PEZI|nr:uncharacterized protein CKM354_000622700 [Cercospora kikuchii]GIZ42981.1 hypothetical protein CKM354_000622700 [Cercospora kikuchii]